MKRCRFRKNNKGDTLILVIGCIALISVLGVILLAKVHDNQAMKLDEKKAHESFASVDASSAELVTALEAMAQDTISSAFSDMMIEYSLSTNGEARMDRYEEYYEQALKKALNAQTMEKTLKDALGVTSLTDLTVERGTIEITTKDAADIKKKTDIIRIPNVVLSYTADGTKTTISTDICIQTKIPDVEGGFGTGIHCDFSDFALITDENTTTTGSEVLNINGNLYVGGTLSAGEVNLTENKTKGTINVTNASKVLVHDDIKLEEEGVITVSNSSELAKGLGVWANGINVKGGSFSTSKTNVYVADDLTIQGNAPSVVMTGSNSEYIGYSGGTSALKNFQRSSAITINNAKKLNLDLHELKRLLINGYSYIYDEEKWTSATEGVLQGESVAYKDMQAMYLFPSECLSTQHNPTMGEVTPTVISFSFVVEDTSHPGSTITIDLEQYVNAADPIVVHTTQEDAGMTKATYAYFKFKDEKAAADFVELYMSLDLGNAIKRQVKNLDGKDGAGAVIKGKIQLAGETVTAGHALTYDGTSATYLAPATTSQKAAMETDSLDKKQKYRSLFSSLRLEGGSFVSPSYKLLKKGILYYDDLIKDLSSGEKEKITVTAGEDYTFVLYKGNLSIDSSSSPYKTFKGILLVDGDLTISATDTQITGLVLATGKVNVTTNTILTAKAEAVNALLENEDVAKYFRGFAAESSSSYLSSESVSISFENWKKN